jgi:hypothetical protein
MASRITILAALVLLGSDKSGAAQESYPKAHRTGCRRERKFMDDPCCEENPPVLTDVDVNA